MMKNQLRSKKENSSNLINQLGNNIDHEKYLKNYYYNPKNPGAFTGLSTLRRHIKKDYLKNLPSWIQEQETYTLHKPARKKFKRNRIIVYGIDDTWQADLIDLQNIAKENNNYKYLLTIIDVFSKYAWVIPLKNKTQDSIITAFKSVFKSRIPKRIHTDSGSEFIGQMSQKYFKENNIKFYTLNSEMKASIVERFNRTIKERMWRFFTKTQKHVYYNVLNDIVNAYNKSYHRSIKMRPIDVNEHNQNKVFFNLYGINLEKKDQTENTNEIRIKFKIGDQVRISKAKYTFAKGYTPNWTSEIFTIDQIILREIPVYKIKDYNENEIDGIFYDSELQKVSKKDDIYKIEKIIRTRKNKKTGKTEYFVKWIGYSDNFNSWVSELYDIE